MRRDARPCHLELESELASAGLSFPTRHLILSLCLLFLSRAHSLRVEALTRMGSKFPVFLSGALISGNCPSRNSTPWGILSTTRVTTTRCVKILWVDIWVEIYRHRASRPPAPAPARSRARDPRPRLRTARMTRRACCADPVTPIRSACIARVTRMGATARIASSRGGLACLEMAS